MGGVPSVKAVKLALSDTLRARRPPGGPRTKIKNDFPRRTRHPTCVGKPRRPSEAAVGFRLNGTKATEGVV